MSSQRLSKDCCGNEYYELVESPEQIMDSSSFPFDYELK